MNTIIDSVQKEEPKRASPVRVERAYIRIYKGPAESRSELCLSLAKTPRPLNVIRVTCVTQPLRMLLILDVFLILAGDNPFPRTTR